MTAPETRAKSTEENVKKLETQLHSYMAETNKKLESTDSKMDDLNHKFDIMMDKLFVNKDRIFCSDPAEAHQMDGSSSRMRMMEPQENSSGKFHSNSNVAKVDCPYFDEGDPRSWLRKCERYFHYNRIIDPQQKLDTAVVHLNGRAESWFFSHQLSSEMVRWPDFVEEICKRFNDSDNNLKAWVLMKHPTIPKEFFLGFFIEGLKEKIRHTVKMLDPFSLSQVVKKARHKEELLDSISRKSRGGAGRQSTQYNSYTGTTWGRTVGNIQKEGYSNSTISANKLFEARKANGECYRCGEKYFPGHQCKDKQLNTLHGTPDQEAIEESQRGDN
ncbi:hypothetical protein A4A49_55634 [Nicotiana attenuata]|uniref:Retrotransposon gag domain-containing protein n=1 Tax=Nicotiana attenuata TaxID=49451 RepID=A0A314KHU8_NICAT|nr:hypothetical protein A4A49_55634 [Nicotiana attenuata]